MTVNIKVKGPLFDRNNVGLPRRTIAKLVARVVEEGDLHLARMLRPRPAGVFKSKAQAGKAYSKGNYRRGIVTTTKGLRGLITDSAEYGPWLEGTSSRNQSTRFKGYHSFRKTTEWFNRKRVPWLVNREIDKMVRKLNGI